MNILYAISIFIMLFLYATISWGVCLSVTWNLTVYKIFETQYLDISKSIFLVLFISIIANISKSFTQTDKLKEEWKTEDEMVLGLSVFIIKPWLFLFVIYIISVIINATTF